MKTLIAAALIVSAGAASAMTSPADAAAIERFVPGANVEALSDADLAVLLNAIHSGDSVSETSAFIRSYLN